MARGIVPAPFPFFLTVPLLWLAFGAALFFHGTDSFLFVPSLLALLPFGLLLTASGTRIGPELPSNGVTLLTGLFWLYLLISLHWSAAPFISSVFFAVFSALPLVFFALIAGDAAQAREKARRHGTAALAMLAALALGALAQFLFCYAAYGPRIHGPLLDPNNLAALMDMGLLPAAALALTAADRQQRRICSALAALFCAGLAVTQSRAGIAVAVLSFCTLLMMLKPILRGRRLAGLLALLAAVIVLLQAYGEIFHGQGLAPGALHAASNSLTDRLALWHGTLRMIRDHVWMGPGLGTFFFYYSAYRLPVDHSDGFFAHMDALQLWAETGLLAPLLFYAAAAAIVLRTSRALRAQPSMPARTVIAGTFASLLAVLLHSHLNFDFYLPAVLIPLGCLLAVWHTATEAALPDRQPLVSRRTARAVFTACLLLAVFAAQWLVRAGIGINAVGTAAAAEARQDADGMDQALAKAVRWAPADFGGLPEYQARADILRLRQDDNLWPSDKQRLFDDGLRANDRAQALNRGFAYLDVERARLYTLAQDDGLVPDGEQRAMTLLQSALKADPLSLEARGGLAALYRRRGDSRDALQVMMDGLNWPRPLGQDNINYLISTARLCALTGDQDCSQKLLNQAGADATAYGLTRPGVSQTGPQPGGGSGFQRGR